mmetsp:Transcript_105144/g.240925  ORF Transcript_105144/g.240925 Transcript_105144/m.240925 type:complete len:202 (-) Transcript_105144:472-1077(-)
MIVRFCRFLFLVFCLHSGFRHAGNSVVRHGMVPLYFLGVWVHVIMLLLAFIPMLGPAWWQLHPYICRLNLFNIPVGQSQFVSPIRPIVKVDHKCLSPVEPLGRLTLQPPDLHPGTNWNRVALQYSFPLGVHFLPHIQGCIHQIGRLYFQQLSVLLNANLVAPGLLVEGNDVGYFPVQMFGPHQLHQLHLGTGQKSGRILPC